MILAYSRVLYNIVTLMHHSFEVWIANQIGANGVKTFFNVYSCTCTSNFLVISAGEKICHHNFFFQVKICCYGCIYLQTLVIVFENSQIYYKQWDFCLIHLEGSSFPSIYTRYVNPGVEFSRKGYKTRKIFG